MPLDLLVVVGGLALLLAGAELLVRGASALALRLGISPLVVGLTVVSFGTSAPELVVSVQAALNATGGIAIGNVIGSNVANVAFILAVTALVRPLRVEAQLIRLDIPLLVGVTLATAALLWDQTLERIEGALLFAGFAGYVGFTMWQAQRGRATASPDIEAALPAPTSSLVRDLVFVGIGLAALVLGADSLVRGATALAESARVPPAVIGLTLVAVGTSLPELATSALAAYRGAGDLAIGNIVGSNLFNALGILGTASLVRPLDAPGLALLDLGAFVAAALLLFPLARTGFEVSRREGVALLVLYGLYLALRLG